MPLILWKMSQNIAPATQNNLEALSNKCHKCRACHAKQHYNLLWYLRKGSLAASLIDTARPQENQRLETRHVGASKRTCHARLHPIFTLCSFKIDVFLRVFLGNSKFATSKSIFPARLPSIFITSHKMPHLPRNLHLVATWRSPDNRIRKHTQHDTSEVLRLPRKMTLTCPKCCACHENCNSSCENVANYCACHTKRLSTRYKKSLMSRSATPATRNEAMRRLKPPKWLLLQNLP